MHCPVDGTTLVLASRDALEIDYCPDCRGVWLDGGELDEVVDSGETISLEPDAGFLRAALIAEVERLRAAIACHTATLGELDGERHAREHASFARAQAADALIAIERAIERIDHGTYGICSVCGERIPAERLEALPSAANCVRCVGAGEGR